MMSDALIIDQPAAGVTRICLNRPAARNALTLAMREGLANQFRALGRDGSVRVIILTGGPDMFAAGADLRELEKADVMEIYLRRVHLLWQEIAQCPKPVIAAVNGAALGGGCELALHADIIIAGHSAKFGQPEVKLGLMPGAGGTQRLVRAVGKFKAAQMLMTGQSISGMEAARLGLASESVPDDEVQPRALTLAIEIAALAPLALEQIKEVLTAGADAPLATALMLERKAFQLLFASQDKTEGIDAFFAKRAADFTGR
jgi:enoyl-CoA hydratase/carnithine racemase